MTHLFKSLDGVLYDRDPCHEVVKKVKIEAEKISYFLVPFHVTQTLRIHSEITLLHFFKWSGIDLIYAVDSTK